MIILKSNNIYYFILMILLNVTESGLGLSLFMSPAMYANQRPRSLAFNDCIKKVAYHADDNVTIRSNHLVETGIYFSADEKIIDIQIDDSLAWDIEYDKNIPFALFIKPKLLASDTHMSVATNTQVYHFHLVNDFSNNRDLKHLTYALTFAYPEKDPSELMQQLNTLRQNVGISQNMPERWNFNYTFCGSKIIAPIQTRDNGMFTVFKFSKNSITPTIFELDKNRNESLSFINFKVKGRYVLVQGVKRQYLLRKGEDVAIIYNDSFAIK